MTSGINSRGRAGPALPKSPSCLKRLELAQKDGGGRGLVSATFAQNRPRIVLEVCGLSLPPKRAAKRLGAQVSGVTGLRSEVESASCPISLHSLKATDPPGGLRPTRRSSRSSSPTARGRWSRPNAAACVVTSSRRTGDGGSATAYPSKSSPARSTRRSATTGTHGRILLAECSLYPRAKRMGAAKVFVSRPPRASLASP